MKRMRVSMITFAVLFLALPFAVWAGGAQEAATAPSTAAPAVTMQNAEAPMLAALVSEGRLPPLAERLPVDPMVVTPVEEIGQYGGVWRSRYSGKPGTLQTYRHLEHPVEWSSDYTELLPSVVKSYEGDADGKVYTFYLREGMKWSDGEPFTADDWLFWYEDIMMNSDLTPVKPAFFSIAGQPGTMEKIDNYTVRVSFPSPYGMFIENLQSASCYAPKHYLSQFHAEYASEAELQRAMRADAFDQWMDLFGSKNTYGDNPDLPGINAWLPLDRFDSPLQRFERNAYYWKVDTAGNQLPYIDYLEFAEIPVETIVLSAIAGEIDMQNRHLSNINNYQMFVENQEKGDYRLVFGVAPGLSMGALYLNYFHPNDAVRETFNDLRFRMALSHAIDREEVNDILYRGLAVPAQQSPSPGDPWYEERFGKAFTEYDVDKANRLLDEMGLKWNARREWRVFPDGSTPEFVVIILGGETGQDPLVEMVELTKGYFQKIGIRIVGRPTDVSLWVSRMRSADFDMGFYLGNAGAAGYAPVKSVFVFPFANTTYWGSQWGLWYATNGQSGVAPPPAVKEMMNLYDAINAEPSMSRRVQLYKQAFELHSDNLWFIGLLNRPEEDHYYIVKNNFRNVPDYLQMEQASTKRDSTYSAQYFIRQ